MGVGDISPVDRATIRSTYIEEWRGVGAIARHSGRVSSTEHQSHMHVIHERLAVYWRSKRPTVG